MKIKNGSRYRTGDVRALVAAALRARCVPSTGLVVEVSVSRCAGNASGRAALGRWRRPPPGAVSAFRYGRWMKLVLSHSPLPMTEAEYFLRVARVVDHEVAHLQGLDHKQMSERLYDCSQDVPWSAGLALRLEDAEDEVASIAASRALRAAHALAMLAKAETCLRRAETIAKKWRRRAAAHERSSR